ncbi:hypothetical protein ACFLQ3_02450 [Bacteroidota bacterium]
MTDINRNNYEEYFIDFIEGNLSPSDEDLLMSFLNQNPDLKEELDFIKEAPVLSDCNSYENKAILKKRGLLSEFTTNNFDELCIARIENDLSKKEVADFDKYLDQNKQKQREFSLYILTKFEVDYSVALENKDFLKKKTKKFIFRKNYALISAAASVVVLIALYIFIPKVKDINSQLPIAGIAEKSIKSESVSKYKQEELVAMENLPEEHNMAKLVERQVVISNKLNAEIVEVETVDINRNEYIQIAYLEPVKMKYDFIKNSKSVNIISINTDYENEKISDPKYMSFKSYLASTFNKRIFNKKNNNKLELFDVAQAGVEGINKLTGSKMTLERINDENGNPDKTEFNSRLIAFSAPVKKD